MRRDSEYSVAVRENGKPAFSCGAKSGPHQRGNGVYILDARDRLQRDLHFTNDCVVEEFLPRSNVLADRVSDVFERLFLGLTLGPAAWEPGNRSTEAFI